MNFAVTANALRDLTAQLSAEAKASRQPRRPSIRSLAHGLRTFGRVEPRVRERPDEIARDHAGAR
jgi:hypothetical protein